LFVHVAFWLQFAVPCVHSLMSVQTVPLPLGSVYPVPHWHFGPVGPATHDAFGSQCSVWHWVSSWHTLPLPWTSM
jgi:hypothetical protein